MLSFWSNFFCKQSPTKEHSVKVAIMKGKWWVYYLGPARLLCCHQTLILACCSCELRFVEGWSFKSKSCFLSLYEERSFCCFSEFFRTLLCIFTQLQNLVLSFKVKMIKYLCKHGEKERHKSCAHSRACHKWVDTGLIYALFASLPFNSY